jgi:3-methyladenine DNA glycosylase AlkD
MMTAERLGEALRSHVNPEKAAFFPRFFKTGPGEYGEGDQFLGVTVPDIRKVARLGKAASLHEIEKLLKSPWHEERLLAVILLVNQFEKGDEAVQKQIYDFYMTHISHVNNWDIVDSSARQIVGAYLYIVLQRTKPLEDLARSSSMWERRIAIIATYYWLMRREPEPTIKIATMLLNDPEDLMHKATGWMLREMGKRVSPDVLRTFLKEHAATMPRTMLRYAIEHFDPQERKIWLAKRSAAGVS